VTGFDQGTSYRQFAFSGRSDLTLSIFSDDFRQGITEGPASYYYFEPKDARVEDLASAREFIRPSSDFLSYKKISASVHLVTYRGFADELLTAYLMNGAMLITRFGASPELEAFAATWDR
jgi:hypothetical protein